MRSGSWEEVEADVDALCALASEAFLNGRLEALEYVQRNPFVRPSGRRTWL